MGEDPEEEKHKKLVELIRRIAKEVCYEILDEHLIDYKHEEQAAEEVELCG